MTTVSELVMRLVKAGAGPIEAAAVVAEAYALGAATLSVTLPATLPKSLPAERSRKAVNQAAYRKRLKEKQGASVAMAAAPQPATPAVTDGNTVTGNVTSEPLSILPSFSNSQGIQEEKKQEVLQPLSTEPREAKKRGARMTEDWEPDPKGMKYAADRGLRLVEIEIEITKFRNYWINRTDRDAAKPRWDLCWQNWILNVRSGSNGVAPRPGSKDDTRERTVNALRSLDPFPRADDARRGEGAGAPISGQLSLVKFARS